MTGRDMPARRKSILKPADWGRRLRPDGPEARLLIVDPEPAQARAFRDALAWHGLGLAECVGSADEALDWLGAARQRIDLALMALPLPDEGEVDISAALRDNRSPFRVLRYTGWGPGLPGTLRRLTGTAAVIDLLDPKGLARATDGVLKGADTVGRIVEHRVVPETLSRPWAQAIHRASPGQRFIMPRPR